MIGLQGQPLVAPRHHPGIETLAEYAAGQMRAGFDLVMAAHLRGCAQCRADVAQLEAVGGGLMQTIAPMQMGEHAMATVLARLDDPEPAATSPARSLDSLMASARRRWCAPGTWIATIDTPHDPDDRVFLLSVEAGRATAPHEHSGAEMTQVLTGALSDDGITYRAGDMVESAGENAHHPKVSGDETCICLFATQGRLKPTTLVGRIAFTIAGV